MKVLEIGPAMGYFSIPMAKMAAPDGKVICVDIQKRMLDKLQKHAQRKGVGEMIDTIQSSPLCMHVGHLYQQIDFCLLAYVVHEIPDQEQFFREIAYVMKPGAKVLFCEPSWHVKTYDWERSIEWAIQAGFKINFGKKVKGCRTCELRRNDINIT
jgi:ubiquinone/menaquinone biosynthesis C-methylase UbiE